MHTPLALMSVGAVLAVLISAVAVFLAMGAITLNPDRSLHRLTTDNNPPNNGQQLQTALALAAMTNPGPVSVHTTQNNPAGNVIVVPATSALQAYWGYNVRKGVPAGEPTACYRGVTVEGFLGCTPGADVYLDATSAEASADASGLSHTKGATNIARVGVALSATRIRFD